MRPAAQPSPPPAAPQATEASIRHHSAGVGFLESGMPALHCLYVRDGQARDQDSCLPPCETCWVPQGAPVIHCIAACSVHKQHLSDHVQGGEMQNIHVANLAAHASCCVCRTLGAS